MPVPEVTIASQCHQCASIIVDYSSAIEVRGRVYCCNNCRLIRRGQLEPGVPGVPTCSHCSSPILDSTSMVDHKGRPYCCYNCAAMHMSAAR
jgi:hypothetical protein